jgi:2-polyprenyl-6-hydroxyphenyl methylase/3-demethylubiquinone-9 3-methyltransferase
MKPLRDPEGAELEHFQAACQLAGAKVLEIGCGNGVFTWQYAGLPALLVGIDPKAADLLEARKKEPASPAKVYFTRAMAEAMPFSSGVFDAVLFASSF